jgi:hypothetical protein
MHPIFVLKNGCDNKELVSGGRMVLTFLGRKSEEMLMHGEVGTMWELLAKSLQSLVQKVYLNLASDRE